MRKLPWVNLATALFVNIPEAEFWFWINSLNPNHPTFLKASEAFFVASLNFATGIPLYAVRNDAGTKRNGISGILLNAIFGTINAAIDYTRSNIPEPDTHLMYPPVTISRIIQPYVNLTGIVLHAILFLSEQLQSRLIICGERIRALKH